MIDNEISTEKKIRFSDIFFMPLGCLLQSSPVFILAIVAIIIFASDYVYYNLNIDLPGYKPPDFTSWSISSGFETITNDEGYSWQISYENRRDIVFDGLVRHASPIRENTFPMLSHDILITTGDFSDPNIVKTSVRNHSFRWGYREDSVPIGTINLLHTLPLNQEIRNKLMLIRYDDRVRISGREIFDIRFFKDGDEKWQHQWKDAGCNTILVTSVEIINQ